MLSIVYIHLCKQIKLRINGGQKITSSKLRFGDDVRIPVLHSDVFRALSLRACILCSNIYKICKSLNSVKMSASFALIYASKVFFKRD